MAAKGERGGLVITARAPVEVTYMVKQLELAMRRNIDRSVRRYSLTTPQYMALTVLARHPGMSSADLARRSFVSPQAASEMVAALQRKGLIDRRADAHNQRVLEMHLTELGDRTLGMCSTGVAELEDRMLANLSVDAVDQLRVLLTACLDGASGGDSGGV